MNTAIVYISKHGTTEKIAHEIASKLNVPEENIFNLRKNRNPDIIPFDRVIIGGSIHAGMIQKRVKDFLEKNMLLLIEKETGLFMSAMEEEKLMEEYENAFPERLRAHSKSFLLPGGEFVFEKMNFLEKTIIKKIAKTDKSVSKIDSSKIDQFIEEMNG